MKTVENLNIALGIIKYASPRWMKVFSSLPNEAAKIDWIRKFIPKNIGELSVNKYRPFGLPQSIKVPLNRLSTAVSGNSTSSELVNRFKDAHREILSNPTQWISRPPGYDPRSNKFRAGTSWLRDYNRLAGKNVNPNELIPFSHGGGADSISNFLKGQGGYFTDSGAKGIMITPHTLEAARDPYYASRAAARTFETPAALSGYIPAKYLKGSRNIGYEASIPTKYYDKIVNPAVKQFSNDNAAYQYYSDGAQFALNPGAAAKYDWDKFNKRVSRANSLESINKISNL